MVIQPPPRPLESGFIDKRYLAKQKALDSIPGAARSKYWALVAKNQAPNVGFWFFAVVSPVALIFFLVLVGPNLYDTPNLVAGKLSSINSLVFIFLLYLVWILALKTRRVAVPRSTKF
jgi:hypothetical protein